MTNNPIADYFAKGIATFDGNPAANDYQRGHLDALKVAKAELAAVPIPLLLFCPKCGLQHVDSPDQAKGWNNPPHKSHLCAGCGTIWRPADVPTTGVERIDTRGKADSMAFEEGIAVDLAPAGGGQ